ncbi:hypothetical protein POKO110462_18350 [Pontibacter korlensis]
MLTLFAAFSCGESPPSESAAGAAGKGVADTTAETPDTASSAPQRLESLEDLRREYSDIASGAESGGMDSTFFDYNCRGEKAGRVVYLSDEGGLRLIRHTYSEYSHFSAKDEYFMKDGTVFFVLYRHVSWHFEGEGETRDEVTEKRFYLIDGKPLRCLEKKYSFTLPASADRRAQKAANRETDCSSAEAVLDRFRLLARYGSGEKSPDCLGE